MKKHAARRPIHRRTFLKMTAGALGATSVLPLVPATISKAFAIPANNATGTIMDVEHVVIFMQENRSFDHYFGTLNGVRGFGDPRAIRLPGGASVWRQPSQEHPDGYVMPFHGDSTVTNSFRVDGSAQGHQASLTILNGGKFDQWGHSNELHSRMAYYTAKDLRFYYALASAFTICDNFHCSTLTQTYPNRMHLWTGCNGGGKVGGDPEMDNYGEHETPWSDMETDQPLPRGPLTWTTYPERLEAKGISWKVYQEYDNFQDNLLSVFKPFRPAPKDSPLYLRGRSWVTEHETDPVKRKRSDGTPLVEAFRRDLASGNLPQVSWIVTAADLSEHPQYEPAKGESVCARLIEALVDFPEMFAKTVFIINYDETGGFFDHLPPPLPPFHPDQGFSTVAVDGEGKHYDGPKKVANPGTHPIGLGMRVPGIIVSPWSRGGWVCSEVFDHISPLRFLEKRFGVMEENIGDWRRAVCGDLTSAFDFKTPNQDWTNLALPSTADYLQRVAKSDSSPSLTIPKEQLPAKQDGPQRLARALPYELHAHGRWADGRFWIDFVNNGGAGAVFQVYDNSGQSGPWRYTIEKAKSYSASHWHDRKAGDYDLSLHGANGFLRQFTGQPPVTNTQHRAEVELAYDTPNGNIVLTLKNTSDAPLVFEAAQDAVYSVAATETRRRSIPVAPGSKLTDTWNLAPTDRWYDITVTLKGVPGFLRRFAGHMENGQPSKTDPAIGPMRI